MSGICFNSGSSQKGTAPPKSYCKTCRPEFLIVVGDPGLGGHASGNLFNIAAEYHYKEIQSNLFPGLPTYDKDKHNVIKPIRISTVEDLSKVLEKHTNIVYLAYFGHSWGATYSSKYGVLMIGEADALDTNLGNAPGKNNTPLSSLRGVHNLNPSAQIRLFGCQGSYTGPRADNPINIPESYPPARQIADLAPKGVTVYGYQSNGGSLFTTDKKLGHGDTRKITNSDMSKTFGKIKKGDPLWLVSVGADRGWQSWKK